MNRSILVFVLMLFCINTFSQSYSCRIINIENEEPVAYANIGIMNRNVGTVSDADGWFELEISNTFNKDTLRISCIGYSDMQFLVSDFKNNAERTGFVLIELSPRPYKLDEVIIRPGDSRAYTLGFYCDSNSAYGNAFYSSELGTEMGVHISLPRKEDEAYIKSVRFYVGEFTFDTFPLRFNIYDLDNGHPGKNILREPIFIEITAAGEYELDLSRYNITVKDDFFVSLEYYRVPDNAEGKLVFCAVHKPKRNKASSYYRWTSQGNWQEEMFDHVGFSVEVICRKH